LFITEPIACTRFWLVYWRLFWSTSDISQSLTGNCTIYFMKRLLNGSIFPSGLMWNKRIDVFVLLNLQTLYYYWYISDTILLLMHHSLSICVVWRFLGPVLLAILNCPLNYLVVMYSSNSHISHWEQDFLIMKLFENYYQCYLLNAVIHWIFVNVEKWHQ
jgi:hypothetical protein